MSQVYGAVVSVQTSRVPMKNSTFCTVAPCAVSVTGTAMKAAPLSGTVLGGLVKLIDGASAANSETATGVDASAVCSKLSLTIARSVWAPDSESSGTMLQVYGGVVSV